MKNILYPISFIIIAAVAFCAGIYWQRQAQFDVPKYKLNTALKLQASPDQIGLLPKGAILYEYSRGPSTDTFIMFVNTKNLNSLEPAELEKQYMISPIDAYAE